jgi:adenylate kinase
VVFGRPGAGRGMQAKRLANKHNLVLIATGQLLRDEIEKGSEIGKFAADYMEKGILVPDEIPIRLIEGQIKKNQEARGFIFKGFPRNLVQAYILDGLLRRLNSSVSAMVHFDTSMLTCIKRLKNRGQSPQGRSYDIDTDIIIRRMEEYENITSSVTEYYKDRNKFYSIDGSLPPDDVYKNFERTLRKAARII